MGYSTVMDGSTLFFILVPIVAPICLGLFVALPVLADRSQARASGGSGHRSAGLGPPSAD